MTSFFYNTSLLVYLSFIVPLFYYTSLLLCLLILFPLQLPYASLSYIFLSSLIYQEIYFYPQVDNLLLSSYTRFVANTKYSLPMMLYVILILSLNQMAKAPSQKPFLHQKAPVSP